MLAGATPSCLDVQGNNDTAGATVFLYTCHASYSNQQWNLVPLQGPLSDAADAFPAGGTGQDWDTTGVNWAEGGTATQSSTWGDGQTSHADLALDGDISGNDSQSDIAATNAQQYPWWQDDMGDSYQISAVNIYNRTDCCTSTTSNYYVFTSNTPFDMSLTPAQQSTTAGVTSTYEPGAAATPSVVVLPAGTTARYLMIQGAGTSALFLDQVTTSSDTYTHLVDPSGQCLSAQGSSGKNMVEQAPCDPTSDGQTWALNPATSSLSVWVGGVLDCATVETSINWYQGIYTRPCRGAASQQWLYDSGTAILSSAANAQVVIGYIYPLNGDPPVLGTYSSGQPLNSGHGGPTPFVFG